MNRPKQIGTAAETAVVRYLQGSGFPHAERRALRGILDAGDITGTPGVCWEVKGGEAAKNASDGQIADWLVETATETANAGSDAGVLVLQRRGVGPRNASRWWTILNGWDLVGLGMDLGNTRSPALLDFPVRLLLADTVTLLRAAGYGEPLPAVAA